MISVKPHSKRCFAAFERRKRMQTNYWSASAVIDAITMTATVTIAGEVIGKQLHHLVDGAGRLSMTHTRLTVAKPKPTVKDPTGVQDLFLPSVRDVMIVTVKRTEPTGTVTGKDGIVTMIVVLPVTMNSNVGNGRRNGRDSIVPGGILEAAAMNWTTVQTRLVSVDADVIVIQRA